MAGKFLASPRLISSSEENKSHRRVSMAVQPQWCLLQVPGHRQLSKAVSHLDPRHRQGHVASLKPIATVKSPAARLLIRLVPDECHQK